CDLMHIDLMHIARMLILVTAVSTQETSVPERCARGFYEFLYGKCVAKPSPYYVSFEEGVAICDDKFGATYPSIASDAVGSLFQTTLFH
ncbi:hypothetical protein PENTCL1PPCAC_15615, partial [Pristionchus entomophagus]